MSAYIVDDKVINGLVNYLQGAAQSWRTEWTCKAFEGYDLKSREDAERLANDLFKLNCRAVDERYGEGEASEFRSLNFQYRFSYPLPAVKAYKCFSELLYQCNEGDVPKTELFQALKEAYNRLAHNLVQTKLQGDGWAD